jgi:hypothetical protein
MHPTVLLKEGEGGVDTRKLRYCEGKCCSFEHGFYRFMKALEAPHAHISIIMRSSIKLQNTGFD